MISDRYYTTEFAACSYALCDGVTGAFLWEGMDPVALGLGGFPREYILFLEA